MDKVTLIIDADELAVIYCAVNEYAESNAALIDAAPSWYLSENPDNLARMTSASRRVLDKIDNLRVE